LNDKCGFTLLEEETLMSKLARPLAVISAVLSLGGTVCIGYSVIDKFKGREYGDVTADGSVSRTADYDLWAAGNDRRTYWGLIIVVISGVLQIASLYVPDDKARATPEPKQVRAGA
jgi:hypothetical protein